MTVDADSWQNGERNRRCDQDRVILLECNIDDMTAEELAFALEELLARGALDAWFTPIQMKKGRPGTMLSVLCAQSDADELREYLLGSTSTLGVRWRLYRRAICERRIVSVETVWGTVRCKLKLLDGQVLSIKPEYDDCARLARREELALRQVTETVQRAAEERYLRGE